MRIIAITSPLHAEFAEEPSEEIFIQIIESLAGQRFEFISSNNFSSEISCSVENNCAEISDTPFIFFYIRSGGTEGIFKETLQNFLSYEKSCKSTWADFKIILLTSGQSNSLAASMEILSYLHYKGLQGEILHGTPEYIASRIKELKSLSAHGRSASSGELNPDSATSGQEYCNCSGNAESCIRKFEPVDLCGARLGVVGRPSDWLISSDVDYAKARRKMNVELVDITMEELLECINRRLRLKLSAGEYVDMRSFKGSEIIYEALKDIVAKYNLKGLTLRCFDLLDTIHNTGCLALARLNAEGIAAGCEGDLPALISMYYQLCKRRCPGFQCNLSKIEGDKLLFAHCTVPLQMVDSYKYVSHFESGIGTAIKGEMHLGRVEIFKIAPDLERYVSIEGEIVSNENNHDLCRTQIVVKAPGAAQYFLRSPLANHHIISYVQLPE